MQRVEMLDLFLIRTLKTLVASQIPFGQGINQWASYMQDQPVRRKTKQLGDLMNSGMMVSDAIRESDFPASANVVRLLNGIERNPNPEVFLQTIEEQIIGTDEARGKLREVIVYPAFLLIGMSLVILIMAFTLMESIYNQGWETNRPLFFWLFSILHPLRFLLVLLVPVTCYAAYRFLKDPMLLPIPGVREVYLNTQRALFCQFLQLEIQNQRTIGEAMNSAAEHFPVSFRMELEVASESAREGFPLAEDSGELLTKQIRYYLNTAGEKDALTAALGKLRKFYLEQSRIHAITLQSTVEVAGLVVLGIMVGFLVAGSFDFYYGYIIGQFPF